MLSMLSYRIYVTVYQPGTLNYHFWMVVYQLDDDSKALFGKNGGLLFCSPNIQQKVLYLGYQECVYHCVNPKTNPKLWNFRKVLHLGTKLSELRREKQHDIIPYPSEI